MDKFPEIRVSIEGLKMQILHQFNDMNNRYADFIRESIEKQITPRLIELEVQDVVYSGMKDLVRGMVGKYVEKLLADPEYIEKLEDLIKEALYNSIEEATKNNIARTLRINNLIGEMR